MTRNEIIEAANKQFELEHIWAEASPKYGTDDFIEVEVEGDWKHDHLRTNRIMNELGCMYITQTIHGESDSDDFTSTHLFQC